MNELLHQPGFLGTNANFAADMTLVIMLLIGGFLTLGFVMARKKRYETHRWIQTSAVILNGILVLWMMLLPFRDFCARSRWTSTGIILYNHNNPCFHRSNCVSPWEFYHSAANGLMPKPLQFSNYKLFMRTVWLVYADNSSWNFCLYHLVYANS